MTESSKMVRAVGLPGAVMMGMGSIVGTGVFVSLGLAAGLTGPSMLLALFLAGFLATCNGLSTAQLAADHPVSGGTYEYGYRYLNPWLGFMAGWLFVCAKSASAATAAIGFGGYFLRLFGLEGWAPWQVGLLITVLVVVLAASGIRRSNEVNMVIVSLTLSALTIYVLALASQVELSNFSPLFVAGADRTSPWWAFLEATALMFVAYTGYGRVATLGEEITDPGRNIPKAVILTLGLSLVLYLGVAAVSVGTVGSAEFYRATVSEAAPLEVAARTAGHPWVANLLAVGAMTAMLGVLLNLVLGLSRVLFSMGRKGDLPKVLGRLDHRQSPLTAILVCGMVILGLVLLREVKTTWSFSALTVLLYYAITNLSALSLPTEKRLYPRWLAWFGLVGCLGLGWWIETRALVLGLGVIFLGFLWRVLWRS